MAAYREYPGTAVLRLDGTLTPVADVCGVNVFWYDISAFRMVASRNDSASVERSSLRRNNLQGIGLAMATSSICGVHRGSTGGSVGRKGR